MEYETAIALVKAGEQIYRIGGLGADQYAYRRNIDEQPSLWICRIYPNKKEEHWPWNPSQSDYFANDWEIRNITAPPLELLESFQAVMEHIDDLDGEDRGALASKNWHWFNAARAAISKATESV